MDPARALDDSRGLQARQGQRRRAVDLDSHLLQHQRRVRSTGEGEDFNVDGGLGEDYLEAAGELAGDKVVALFAGVRDFRVA